MDDSRVNMASNSSSRSTTRDDTSDDSTATLHNGDSHKEHSGAENDGGEEQLANAEKLAYLSERVSGSSENDVAAVSPEGTAKPATIASRDAKRSSVVAVEEASEHPLPASSEGGGKSTKGGAADTVTEEQWRLLALSLRSFMFCGLLLVVIAAAFAYAIMFRAGRVLPRKAKRTALLANDTNHVFI